MTLPTSKSESEDFRKKLSFYHEVPHDSDAEIPSLDAVH